MLIIKSCDVAMILKDNEYKIMEIVKQAYINHYEEKSVLPHSIFLRFPNNSRDRIIGLPAYLQNELRGIAGFKWISSFPDNINKGKERASAIIILNDMTDGHVLSVMEGSIISAKRTAASAALAAKHLHGNIEESSIGFIGCGRINYEIFNFLKLTFNKLKNVNVFDSNVSRAKAFVESLSKTYPNINYNIAESIDYMIANSPVLCLATTAGVPYISSASLCEKDTTILDISLRDFSPEFVLRCDNIVDDISHVCREKTSMELTSIQVGNREFIRCTLAEVLLGKAKARVGDKPIMFSPFGLGVLDLALADYVYEYACSNGIGTELSDFY